MTNDAAQFIGDIPENYDRCLGPHIFEDYAADLARRAAELKPQSVLELAAGTGIVSRMLRDALPQTSELTVTDLNEPMLGVAKRKFKPGEKVTFRPADAMMLPFDDGTFDLIVSQFGVMFFPDKVGSYSEARRVLRSGGRYLFNVWGSMARNPFAAIASETGARFFPDNPPRFYQVPFGYCDTGAITAELAEAGFEDIRHQTLNIEKGVKDWALFAHGLTFGNPLIVEIRTRGTAQPEDLEAALAQAFRDRLGPEPSSMPLEAIVFSARKA